VNKADLDKGRYIKELTDYYDEVEKVKIKQTKPQAS
jgi:hypothetical protein